MPSGAHLDAPERLRATHDRQDVLRARAERSGAEAADLLVVCVEQAQIEIELVGGGRSQRAAL